MTPTPPPSGSYFWSAAPVDLPGWLLPAVLITVGAIAAVWVALLRRPCTAAGVEMSPPADGAEVAAEPTGTGAAGGSTGPDRAAPAPAAPLLPRGAAGVAPPLVALALLAPDDPRLPVDPVDADVEDWVALLPGVAPAGGGR